jgi:excisionase family DNA binding protein
MTVSTDPLVQDRLLRPEEAADLLGVSPRLVSDMARRGDLPHVRVGRFPRFRRQDLDEWIEANLR